MSEFHNPSEWWFAVGTLGRNSEHAQMSETAKNDNSIVVGFRTPRNVKSRNFLWIIVATFEHAQKQILRF